MPVATGFSVTIELVEITEDNHRAVRALAVRPDQKKLVASVDSSLADAYIWKDALFRAALKDGTPIGYVLVFPFDRDGHHVVNIVRLMVDAAFQGRGYGRAILNGTLDWISTFSPRPDLLRISTVPENEPALALYLSLGFEPRGTEDGEIALYRRPL
jgi:diamine N-acetyltransferase